MKQCRKKIHFCPREINCVIVNTYFVIEVVLVLPNQDWWMMEAVIGSHGLKDEVLAEKQEMKIGWVWCVQGLNAWSGYLKSITLRFEENHVYNTTCITIKT